MPFLLSGRTRSSPCQWPRLPAFAWRTKKKVATVSGHPFTETFSIERLPDLRPFRARVLGRQVLHRDELSGHERAPTGHTSGPQPRLRGDAVLVLTEDRLQLGRGARECDGALADDRG